MKWTVVTAAVLLVCAGLAAAGTRADLSGDAVVDFATTMDMPFMAVGNTDNAADLLALIACSAFAESAPAADTITLIGPNPTDWIHVGDSTPSWPPSVGPAWTSSFTLTPTQVSHEWTLSFRHFEADPARNVVRINGIQLGMLTQSDGVFDLDPYNPANWVQQGLSVPSGTLVAGVNSIRVEAGVSFPGSSFPLDDFMLKDMTLVPEPATMSLLALGGLTLLRRRKRK